MWLRSGIFHHQMERRAGVEGETAREQRLDTVGKRAIQLLNFVGADADGRIEPVFRRQQIGEHVCARNGRIAGRLVREIAAHIEIQGRLGRVSGNCRGSLTRAMRRVIELHNAVERRGQVEVGDNCYGFF